MSKLVETNEPRTCIYCRQVKNYSNNSAISDFDREHVLQAGLLRDIDRPLILYGRVCKICNNTFGKGIDQSFLRSGYVGLFRFDNGLKKAKEFRDFDEKSIVLNVHAPHISSLNGAGAERLPKEGSLTTILKPKVSIETTSGWKQLNEAQIDAGEVPDPTDLKENGAVKFSCDSHEEEDRISEKLRRLISFVSSGETYVIGTVNVLGHGEIGPLEMRAFSKIAYNYLAHTLEKEFGKPDQILAPCFDRVRSFVADNRVPEHEFIIIERDDILPSNQTIELPNRKRHLIGLYIEGKHAFVRLRLFNAMIWRVTLTDQYSGPKKYSNYLHEWNLETKTCLSVPKREIWSN